MKLIAETVLDCFEPGEASPALAPSVDAPAAASASDRMVPAGAFAIFDQGVVSGTNFLTTLILARSCSQDELGVYSLAWTVVLFLTRRARKPDFGAVHDVLSPPPRRRPGGICRQHVGPPIDHLAGGHGLFPGTGRAVLAGGWSRGRAARHGRVGRRDPVPPAARVCPPLHVCASGDDDRRHDRHCGRRVAARESVGIAAISGAFGGRGLWCDGGGMRRCLPVLVVAQRPADAFLAASAS